jgi:mRNA interferase MazF
MTRYSRGDVLLLPFPFADALAEKKRPVVVVSSEEFMKGGTELIVAMITSQASFGRRPGDHRLSDWRKAGLLGPSTVRSRLATINEKRVIRRLGGVIKTDMQAIDSGLRLALQL